MRNISANIPSADMYDSRDELISQVTGKVSEDIKELGLILVSYSIREIDDSPISEREFTLKV